MKTGGDQGTKELSTPREAGITSKMRAHKKTVTRLSINERKGKDRKSRVRTT